jgi:hypothetical protein
MLGVLLGKEWFETGAPWRKIRTLKKRTTCLFSAKSTIRLACKTSRLVAESNCNHLRFLRSAGITSNHECRENMTPRYLLLQPKRLLCDNKGPSKNNPTSVGIGGPRKRSITPIGTDRGNSPAAQVSTSGLRRVQGTSKDWLRRKRSSEWWREEWNWA